MYIQIDKNNTRRIICYGNFNLEFLIALTGILREKKLEGGFLMKMCPCAETTKGILA